MIQKSAASTLGTLVEALGLIFELEPKVKRIGTCLGEKMFESLLINEEAVHAIDTGSFYRIPADSSELNYDLYFEEGLKLITEKEYNSMNTYQLNASELAEKLLVLLHIKHELKQIEISKIKLLVKKSKNFFGKTLLAD